MPAMRSARVAVYLLVITLAAVYLLPLLVIALNSLRTTPDIFRNGMIGLPHGLAFDNFASAWCGLCIAQHCTGIRSYMMNSFVMTLPATILSTFFGALLGYAISLWRFRGDLWVFGLITLGVFLPEQMKLVPWVLVLRDLGLYNSVSGLVLIHVVQGISFTTLFCRNYYVGIPPELVKAAKIDGAGFFRVFWRIVLPLSPPILIVTVIWQFTGIWNEFLYGVTFTTGGQQPVTAALIAIATTPATDLVEYGIQSAAVLLAALPTLLVYFFGGRYFMRGLTAGAIK
jgi:glucose/mannose transport system permease protein